MAEALWIQGYILRKRLAYRFGLPAEILAHGKEHDTQAHLYLWRLDVARAAGLLVMRINIVAEFADERLKGIGISPLLLRNLGAHTHNWDVVLAKKLHLLEERVIQILHKVLKHILFVPVVGVADVLSIGKAGGR